MSLFFSLLSDSVLLLSKDQGASFQAPPLVREIEFPFIPERKNRKMVNEISSWKKMVKKLLLKQFSENKDTKVQYVCK